MNSKLAIITGASHGIGQGMAYNLAAQNYNLALLARNQQQLLSLKDKLLAKYDISANIFPIDISNKQMVDEAISQIVAQHKRIDLLFNNAGVLHEGTSEIHYHNLQELVQTNLMGAFHLVHAICPYMKQQKQGYIINMASKACIDAPQQYGVYAATKSGLLGFNEALFKELKPYHIKVTAICPGVVNTEMAKNFKNIQDHQKIQITDINHTVNYLLQLNDTAHIQELVLQTQL